MRAATAITTLLCASLATLAAHAEPVKLGLATPLSGPSAILGEQVKSGAELAATRSDAVLVIADDGCTAEGGAKAAQVFIDAKVAIAAGFLCTEAVEAALPVLKAANIPVISVGVRTDSLTDLRDKTAWPLFRLGPRGDGERNAAASILTRLWNDELFAIIDDGTIYGRELAESFRASAEQAGLKPVFFDTYRPQLDNQVALIGRLRKAGATHVFVGGDGEDIAVMGRDAASLGADIIFAGGETLRVADRTVPPATGTLMIAPPEWSDVAKPEVRSAFEAARTMTDGYTLPGYAAVEIAGAAARLAASSGKPVADMLAGQDFDSAIGTIRFDAKGDLVESPFRLFRFDGTSYLPAETQ